MNESDDEYVNDAIDNMTLELTGAPRLERALFAASWERMVLLAALDHLTSGFANDRTRIYAARIVMHVMDTNHPYRCAATQSEARAAKASLDSTERLLATGRDDNLSLSDALRQCVGVLEDMRGDFVEPYFNARLKALTHAYAALGVSGPLQQEQTAMNKPIASKIDDDGVKSMTGER